METFANAWSALASFFELPGLYGESDNLDECMGEAGPPWVTLKKSRVWKGLAMIFSVLWKTGDLLHSWELSMGYAVMEATWRKMCFQTVICSKSLRKLKSPSGSTDLLPWKGRNCIPTLWIWIFPSSYLYFGLDFSWFFSVLKYASNNHGSVETGGTPVSFQGQTVRKSIQSLGGSTVFGQQRGWEEAKKAQDQVLRMVNAIWSIWFDQSSEWKFQGATVACYSDESPGLMNPHTRHQKEKDIESVSSTFGFPFLTKLVSEWLETGHIFQAELQFRSVFQSQNLGMCRRCTEAVHCIALWTRTLAQLWACVKHVSKQFDHSKTKNHFEQFLDKKVRNSHEMHVLNIFDDFSLLKFTLKIWESACSCWEHCACTKYCLLVRLSHISAKRLQNGTGFEATS